MHARNAKNVVKKARYRRESFKEINKEFKLVDRKLRQTSLRDSRSDTIHAILSVLIKIRTREI